MVSRMPASQIREGGFLTAADRTEMRRCIENSRSPAGIRRPDAAAYVLLFQSEDPRIAEEETRKTIEHLRQTPEVGITTQPIRWFHDTGDPDVIAAAFGDSSWASAQNLKIQTCAIIVWARRGALARSASISTASWRSARTQRQARSTLVAEACAANVAVDSGSYAITFLSEVLTGVLRRR
ncbi:unnamed protein product [Prorocentrum cordatum]|uniref:Uncharacterized protein n=1 Tax=Prorocentrum cordatum TaxID=2364126 RepID=A0ABN9WR54_9DINO|nr:unnamed protein product [Polarella glacialis]